MRGSRNGESGYKVSEKDRGEEFLIVRWERAGPVEGGPWRTEASWYGKRSQAHSSVLLDGDFVKAVHIPHVEL